MNNLDWKKYFFTFLITALIFFTAIFLSNHFGNKKIAELRSIQDQIATSILSSEVQTSLLEQFSCKELSTTLISRELGELGDKLSTMEENRRSDDPELVSLKQNYSLFEIKDFILMNKVREKCGTKNAFILYFYGKECDDCQKQGYVLTKLRQDYPDLRVYSFDYNLDLPALKTLISINKISSDLPALLIDDELYYGFQSIENIEKAIPQIAIWKKENESKSATSTIAH